MKTKAPSPEQREPVTEAECAWCQSDEGDTSQTSPLCEECMFHREVYAVRKSGAADRLAGTMDDLQGMLPGAEREAMIDSARRDARAILDALAAEPPRDHEPIAMRLTEDGAATLRAQASPNGGAR